jgi:hypothetical protein
VRLAGGRQDVGAGHEEGGDQHDAGEPDGEVGGGLVEPRSEHGDDLLGAHVRDRGPGDQHERGEGEDGRDRAVGPHPLPCRDRAGDRGDHGPRHRPGDEREQDVHHALRDEVGIDGSSGAEDRRDDGVAHEAEHLAEGREGHQQAGCADDASAQRRGSRSAGRRLLGSGHPSIMTAPAQMPSAAMPLSTSW